MLPLDLKGLSAASLQGVATNLATGLQSKSLHTSHIEKSGYVVRGPTVGTTPGPECMQLRVSEFWSIASQDSDRHVIQLQRSTSCQSQHELRGVGSQHYKGCAPRSNVWPSPNVLPASEPASLQVFTRCVLRSANLSARAVFVLSLVLLLPGWSRRPMDDTNWSGARKSDECYGALLSVCLQSSGRRHATHSTAAGC